MVRKRKMTLTPMPLENAAITAGQDFTRFSTLAHVF
jgi:hypothetical protein